MDKIFLSTPSARRATRTTNGISAAATISIHALREEGDECNHDVQDWFRVFLSTPSARRATGISSPSATVPLYFYPRPPRGGRPGSSPGNRHLVVISIHALREEGDRQKETQMEAQKIFLSTPSARRATRAGVDSTVPESFLSTPSARRATSGRLQLVSNSVYFYPRPPRGGRPDSWCRTSQRGTISIHALREEGDHERRNALFNPPRFLSTPSARRATPPGQVQQIRHVDFYPRPPRGGRPPRLLRLFSTFLFLSTPSARRAT